MGICSSIKILGPWWFRRVISTLLESNLSLMYSHLAKNVNIIVNASFAKKKEFEHRTTSVLATHFFRIKLM